MDIMASDDFTIDLSEDEIAALELPYKAVEEPKVEKVAKADPAPARSEPEPKRVDQDQSDLLRRVREAEERAANERKARIDAERLAHERGTTVAVTSARAAEGEFTAVANALARTDQHIETLVAQKRAALESGDYDAESKISLQLAQAVAKQEQLREGKLTLEDRVKQARANAEAASKTQAPKSEPSDPFEAFVAGQPPKAAAWFRENPQFAPMNNKKNFSKALAAHHDALANDIDEGSDAYFAHLNKKLGIGGSDDVDEVVEKVETPKKAAPKADKPARVAAPVSRDGVVERLPDGRVQLRLTAEQAKMADELGMSRTAYAKNLAKIQAGSRDPNYNGPRLGQNE